MNYTNKYLKYKNKYLNLLKLRGGNPYEIINIYFYILNIKINI